MARVAAKSSARIGVVMELSFHLNLTTTLNKEGTTHKRARCKIRGVVDSGAGAFYLFQKLDESAPNSIDIDTRYVNV